MLGVNAFFGTVPLDKFDDFKVVRAYASAGSFCPDSNQYMFDPTWQNFHYDDYLADAHSRGMKVMLCLTKNFQFYTANNSTQNEDHPVPPGADKSNPASYLLYARLAFQIAARYGGKTVDTSLLKVKEFPVGHWQHQDKFSGADWLYGIEIWNEADRWGGNFTAPEYFALLSACYDGHKGTLGPDAGVAQADPDMKIFFTGTTDNTTTFTKNVKDLWVQQRGEPFPDNIIFNFHAYFHNKEINHNNRTTGIEPELANATALYKRWADFCGSYRLAKTEYGYDTNDFSIQKAPLQSRLDTGFYSREESQAALILRDFHLQSVFSQFVLSTFYSIRDENPWSSFQYSTCGVTYGGSQYAPKESYFILSGFLQLSDGFYSPGAIVRQDPYVVRYSNDQGKFLYALWSYEKNNYTIPDVTTTDNEVLMLASTKAGVDSTTIIPQGGSFSVDAGHMPVYFIADNPLAFNVPVCGPIAYSYDSVCAGDSALIYGVYRKNAGIYYDTLVGNECDSIIATNLKVNPCGALTISGIITTETGAIVTGVNVHLSGSEANSVTTAGDGAYSFLVPANGDYVTTPQKNNDVTLTNGVSTLDMILIQRHILGMVPLGSPCKIIAADVNGSGTVTTLDIVLMRAFILGINTSFPGNKLWQFVRSDYTFVNPSVPFPFESMRTFPNITQSQTSQNFIGIKLGDVNGSWDAGVP